MAGKGGRIRSGVSRESGLHRFNGWSSLFANQETFEVYCYLDGRDSTTVSFAPAPARACAPGPKARGSQSLAIVLRRFSSFAVKYLSIVQSRRR
jgi:hypothetical protein